MLRLSQVLTAHEGLIHADAEKRWIRPLAEFDERLATALVAKCMTDNVSSPGLSILVQRNSSTKDDPEDRVFLYVGKHRTTRFWLEFRHGPSVPAIGAQEERSTSYKAYQHRQVQAEYHLAPKPCPQDGRLDEERFQGIAVCFWLFAMDQRRQREGLDETQLPLEKLYDSISGYSLKLFHSKFSEIISEGDLWKDYVPQSHWHVDYYELNDNAVVSDQTLAEPANQEVIESSMGHGVKHTPAKVNHGVQAAPPAPVPSQSKKVGASADLPNLHAVLAKDGFQLLHTNNGGPRVRIVFEADLESHLNDSEGMRRQKEYILKGIQHLRDPIQQEDYPPSVQRFCREPLVHTFNGLFKPRLVAKAKARDAARSATRAGADPDGAARASIAPSTTNAGSATRTRAFADPVSAHTPSSGSANNIPFGRPASTNSTAGSRPVSPPLSFASSSVVPSKRSRHFDDD